MPNFSLNSQRSFRSQISPCCITVSQDRKRLGDEFWSKPLNLVRGVFDLEVRRERQVFAAVALIEVGIMDIE